MIFTMILSSSGEVSSPENMLSLAFQVRWESSVNLPLDSLKEVKDQGSG